MTSSDINGLVYGWSAFNSFFRLLAGYVSDRYYEVSPIVYPRPLWILLASMFALTGHLLYFAAADGAVWVIDIFTAGIYATSFSIVATQVSLYFGVDNYGFNMGIMSLAPAFAGMTFTSLSSTFTVDHIEEGETQCFGDACFTESFWLSSVFYAIGMITCVFMIKRDIAKTRQEHWLAF
jgi:MFS family permease